MNQDELREADARYGKLNHEYDDGFDAGFEAGKPKWIPVSERLPDFDVDVLVKGRGFHDTPDMSGKQTRVAISRRQEIPAKMGDKSRYVDENDFRFFHVTAWQPLPEPYTEGE